MPFYEYRCEDCGHAFTHLARRMSDAPPACPECGTTNLKKLFSTFSANVVEKSAPSCSLGKCPSQQSCCANGHCPLG